MMDEVVLTCAGLFQGKKKKERSLKRIIHIALIAQLEAYFTLFCTSL